MHFRLDFIIGANTINPDQTAPFQTVLKGAVFPGYIFLQYTEDRLPKNISRQVELATHSYWQKRVEQVPV